MPHPQKTYMKEDDILDTFSKLDLKSYIDHTLTTLDFHVIRNELYRHTKIKKNIDDHLFQTFLLNTHHLIDILERTHYVSKKIVEIRNGIEQYVSVFPLLEEEEDVEDSVDVRKRDKFRRLMNEFRNDCSVFLTVSRYLVYYDVVFAEEVLDSGNELYKGIMDGDKEVGDGCRDEEMKSKMQDLKKYEKINRNRVFVLIFTNDLLIIGENKRNKFEVRNAFNHNIVRMELNDDILAVNVDPLCYKFYKDKDSLDEIINVYKEVNYKKQSKEKKVNKKVNKLEEEDFHSFLRETEQFEELIKFKGGKEVNFLVDDIQNDDGNLFLILKMIDNQKERQDFFFKYLGSIFKKNLHKISPVQKFDKFIDDIYKSFHEAYNFNKKLVREYLKKYKKNIFTHAKYIIFLEEQILLTFKLLGKRIFGKYGNIKGADKYVEKVKQNLSFDNYNFEYLLERFKSEKEKMKEKSEVNIKLQIIKIVDSMIQ